MLYKPVSRLVKQKYPQSHCSSASAQVNNARYLSPSLKLMTQVILLTQLHYNLLISKIQILQWWSRHESPKENLNFGRSDKSDGCQNLKLSLYFFFKCYVINIAFFRPWANTNKPQLMILWISDFSVSLPSPRNPAGHELNEPQEVVVITGEFTHCQAQLRHL